MRRRLWIAFLILCAIGAAAAIRRIFALGSPPTNGANGVTNLDQHFGGKSRMTLLHIVPSLLFVLLVPVQFVSALRERHPRIHGWTGRLILILGLVIGGSALWLSKDPVGGWLEGSATIFFGCFFLFCLGCAWWHIRNRRVLLHREWVIRMVAVALGVATSRPIMGVFFATSRLTGLTPQQFFGVAMWLGFVSTYVAAEVWIWRSSPERHPR